MSGETEDGRGVWSGPRRAYRTIRARWSDMAKSGRPQLPGRRRKGRRVLPQVWDYGSDHVVQARARFARFQDGKAGDHVFDPIGRAWAVGLLENGRVDPAVLRDAGREYAAGYWGNYPSTAGVATYLGEKRARAANDRHGPIEPDPRGDRFNKLDRLLLDAGRSSRRAVQVLVVDSHWFPDANPAWLDRLINARLVDAGAPICMPSDSEMMGRALFGLLALSEGTRAAVARRLDGFGARTY